MSRLILKVGGMVLVPGALLIGCGDNDGPGIDTQLEPEVGISAEMGPETAPDAAGEAPAPDLAPEDAEPADAPQGD